MTMTTIVAILIDYFLTAHPPHPFHKKYRPFVAMAPSVIDSISHAPLISNVYLKRHGRDYKRVGPPKRTKNDKSYGP